MVLRFFHIEMHLKEIDELDEGMLTADQKKTLSEAMTCFKHFQCTKVNLQVVGLP